MKNTNIKITVFLVLLLCTLDLYSFNFFKGGLRNYSLAGTGVASTNDVSASGYNPSLLNLNRDFSILTDSRVYFYDLENDDLSFNYFALGVPLGRYGSLALSGDIFNANLYDENRYGLHWGYSLTDDFGIGTSINYYSISYGGNEYTQNDPFFVNNKTDKSTVDLDFGLYYNLSQQWRLGLSSKNILQSDLAIDSSNEEQLNREILIGNNYQYRKFNFMLDLGLIQNAVTEENELNYALASEYKLYDNLAIRTGINNNDLTFGFGFEIIDKEYVSSYRSSYNSKKMIETKSVVFSVDYAFSYPLLSDLAIPYGNHFVGLSFKFGNSQSSEDELKKHVSPVVEEAIVEIPVKASLDNSKPHVLVDTVYVDKIIRDTIVVVDTIEVITGVPESEYQKKIQELNAAYTKIKTYKTNNQALIHITNATKYYYSSDFEKAIDECNKAIRLAPDMALAYIKLGSIYYRQGKADLAMKNWKIAKRLDPKNPELEGLFDD